MISAPLEQEVGVNAAGQCDGGDRRAGHQALLDQPRLECPIVLASRSSGDLCNCLHGVHHLLLVHTIKRMHSSAQMLASGRQPRKDGVGRTITVYRDTFEFAQRGHAGLQHQAAGGHRPQHWARDYARHRR